LSTRRVAGKRAGTRRFASVAMDFKTSMIGKAIFFICFLSFGFLTVPSVVGAQTQTCAEAGGACINNNQCPYGYKWISGSCSTGYTCCVANNSAGGGATSGSSGATGASGTGPVPPFECDEGYEKMAGVCVPLSETVGGLSEREPGEVVVSVMNWLMGILGILAIVMLVVAGVLYLTAAGDDKKTETAKNIIMYVVIGVAVALTAYTIVYTVQQLVNGGEDAATRTY